MSTSEEHVLPFPTWVMIGNGSPELLSIPEGTHLTLNAVTRAIAEQAVFHPLAAISNLPMKDIVPIDSAIEAKNEH